MKRLIGGVMVVLGFAVMSAVAAEKAGPADVNSDGKVTKEEFFARQSEMAKKAGKELKKEAADKAFSNKDRNKDGVLTKDELVAPAAKPKKPAAETASEE